MKKRGLMAFLLILSVVILARITPFAQEIRLDVKEHILPNGLILLVLEKHDAPTVVCYRYHKVGSVNEYPGMTGASHLLEHMMFKGTKKIGTWNYEAEKPIMEKIEKLMDEIEKERAKGLTGYHPVNNEKIEKLWNEVEQLQTQQRKYIRKNEVDYIYSVNGGTDLNASTGWDATDYYVILPSNRLELWAFMESDRMKEPVFREFYSERNVVYEERRMYCDNDAWGKLFEKFMSTMFSALPYGHDVVGWASDLETMRKDHVLAYLKKYYAPNNTVLVLVGDIKEQKALALVTKYFGDMEPQPEPKPVFTQEPPQEGEKRVEVEFDANPMLFIGYQGPKPGDEDRYALDIISFILSHGRTSRFYKNLVQTDMAYSADSWSWTLGYSNPLMIDAVPKDPHTAQELETAIYKEIEILQTQPVSQRELEKVHNNLDVYYLNSLKSDFGLANALASSQVWTGDWKNFDQREKMKKVTSDDIMRVAKKYLTKQNRTVAILVKKEKTHDSNPGQEEGNTNE